MNFNDLNLVKRSLLVAAISVGLAACSSSDDPPPVVDDSDPPADMDMQAMASFDITVSNLTNAQPLSPVAVIVHDDSYQVFMVGAPATEGLEVLAEGGDNSDLLSEAEASGSADVFTSGIGPIGPGSNETVSFELPLSDLQGKQLSVTTMLVNTNDAFTGLNGFDIGSFGPGQSETVRGIAYESGTEANSETATTIPGPAAGGEGFNPARDDAADQVTMSAGVISRDDGLATSDLTEQHRFDNRVVQVSITRTE